MRVPGAHARRLYAAVTDAARVAAALLATPALRRPAGEAVHRARGVYRQEWTSLTEPWVSCRARSSASKSWIRPEALRAPDGGRPSVRFHLNPRLAAGAQGPRSPQRPR